MIGVKTRYNLASNSGNRVGLLFLLYVILTLQAYHRELMEQRLAALRSQPPPPPPVVRVQQPRKMLPDNAAKELGRASATKKSTGKRTRKSSSKRPHRTKATSGKEYIRL
jgi:hypothetical protein